MMITVIDGVEEGRPVKRNDVTFKGNSGASSSRKLRVFNHQKSVSDFPHYPVSINRNSIRYNNANWSVAHTDVSEWFILRLFRCFFFKNQLQQIKEIQSARASPTRVLIPICHTTDSYRITKIANRRPWVSPPLQLRYSIDYLTLSFQFECDVNYEMLQK